MKARPKGQTLAPAAELQSFIGRLGPKDQKLFRSVRTAIRRWFPSANELAYDYKTSIVIAYSPTNRGIDGIVSIAARPDGVRLYFAHGPELSDPKRLLLGSAKQTRYISVDTVRRLARPDVKALLAAAVEQASVPLPSKGKGRLLIRGSAAKRKTRGAT